MFPHEFESVTQNYYSSDARKALAIAIRELTKGKKKKTKLSPETQSIVDWATSCTFPNRHNLKGIVKSNGRRSYLETHPELIALVQQLRHDGHTYGQIVKILPTLGWKTRNGTEFDRSAVGRLLKQAKFLKKS